MMENLRALMNSKKTLKLIQDDSGGASILVILIDTLNGDTIQIKDKIFIL